MKKGILLVFALLLGLGLFIDNSFFHSVSRKIASENSSADNPSAGDDSGKDLSKLSAEEFVKAFKYSLINPISAIHVENQMGVQLGNFYIKGTDEQKLFVCTKFNFIELTFQAEGIAVSGEIPKMVVRGPCTSSADQNFIQALPIPYKEILSAPISKNEFHVPVADSNDSVLVSFYDTAEAWPVEWNLIGVRLYSEFSDEHLSLTGYEIIAIRGSPFVLDWQH